MLLNASLHYLRGLLPCCTLSYGLNEIPALHENVALMIQNRDSLQLGNQESNALAQVSMCSERVLSAQNM